MLVMKYADYCTGGDCDNDTAGSWLGRMSRHRPPYQEPAPVPRGTPCQQTAGERSSVTRA
jgi:hypothetical protein